MSKTVRIAVVDVEFVQNDIDWNGRDDDQERQQVDVSLESSLGQVTGEHLDVPQKAHGD